MTIDGINKMLKAKARKETVTNILVGTILALTLASFFLSVFGYITYGLIVGLFAILTLVFAFSESLKDLSFFSLIIVPIGASICALMWITVDFTTAVFVKLLL